MDLLHIYDELNDIYDMLDHLKSRQYTNTDIPLTRRDEISNEITKIQEILIKTQNEVKTQIKDEWLQEERNG